MHHRALGPVLLAAAMGLLAALGPAPILRHAHAHSYVEISIDHLAKNADRVVVATPEDEVSVWEDDAGGRRIVTYHRLRVHSDLLGQGDKEVWVRRLGGVVGEIGQRVHGVAPLRRGQPFLLFLHRRDDGNFAVVGMEQGCFPVSISDDAKITVKRRSLSHAPVSGNRSVVPASVLEGQSIEVAKQLIVEARRRNAK